MFYFREISENSYLKEQESQALELERMSPIDMVRKKRRGKKEKTGSFEASFIKPPVSISIQSIFEQLTHGSFKFISFTFYFYGMSEAKQRNNSHP